MDRYVRIQKNSFLSKLNVGWNITGQSTNHKEKDPTAHFTYVSRRLKNLFRHFLLIVSRVDFIFLFFSFFFLPSCPQKSADEKEVWSIQSGGLINVTRNEIESESIPVFLPLWFIEMANTGKHYIKILVQETCTYNRVDNFYSCWVCVLAITCLGCPVKLGFPLYLLASVITQNYFFMWKMLFTVPKS